MASVLRVRTLEGTHIETQPVEQLVREYIYGTGVLIDPAGIIATAAHLLHGMDHLPPKQQAVEVLTHASEHYIPAKVVVVNEERDIAILQVNPRLTKGLPSLCAKHGQLASRPKPGARAYALGIRAEADPFHFEVGIVAGRFVEVNDHINELGLQGAGNTNPLGLSQQVFPGYSGGAILDESGDLVGLLLGALTLEGRWAGFSYGVDSAPLHTLLSRSGIDDIADCRFL